MPNLPLPRFLETHASRLAHAQGLEAVVRESGGDLRAEKPIARDPSDSRTLRGLPAIGMGVRGAIAGSVPGGNLDRALTK